MARENGPRAMVKQARKRLDDSQTYILEFSHAIDPDDPRAGPKKSVRTVSTYTDNLRRFEDRVGAPLLELSTDEVLDAFADLADDLAAQSVAQYQSSVKAFYRWADDHDVDPEAIAVSTSSEPAIDEKQILTAGEFHQIREAAGSSRDRCIVDLLGFTGQRIRVIQTLRVRDVDPEAGRTGRYWINTTAEGLKGAEKAMTRRPLLGARDSIREWLSYHPTGDPDDYLITTTTSTSRGEPGSMVAQNTIRRAVSAAAERADVDKPVNPHAFRHFFATTAIRDYDMDPDVVRGLLGHGPGSRIMETTYRHLSDDDVIEDAEDSYGVPGEDAPEEATAENPLTPPVCPTCSRALDGHEKCPRCGERFGPDADRTTRTVEIGPDTSIADLLAQVDADADGSIELVVETDG